MSTPGVTTLSAIRDAAKQRSDMVGASFVSDAEWLGYIQASYAELYELLVQKYGNDYFVSSTTITTDGTNDTYSLPTDFFKGLGVDLQTSTATNPGAVSLRPFTFTERNRFQGPSVQLSRVVTSLRYRFRGSLLWLTPMPASGLTLKLWYVPRLTALAADSDTVDGVSGWEEYVIVDAALKAKQKGEEDCQELMNAKAALVQRIEAAAENRDAGSPSTVADVTRTNGWGWGGLGDGYDGGGWG